MSERRWLTGWKSIADHFQVSVSTAQRWAVRRGMPVVRDGGTVSTQIEALDKWRWGCQSASNNVRECNTAE
jgi:phage terminase Nu1 subunit (DNA packaging protein)